jgi:hypothetical protein
LQNNHKRGLAIVAEEVLDLEEVLGSGKAGKHGTRHKKTVTKPPPGAWTGAIPKKAG